MTLLKIAFRNVLKNRRRSLITTLAIGFGFLAVAMFKGYTHNAYDMIARAAIFLEMPGHLAIFRQGFLEQGRLDPTQFLFSAEDLTTIAETLREVPEVAWTAPKLTLTGLITNGKVSTIFIADAMNPVDEARLWKHWDFPRPPSRGSDKVLPADVPFAAFLAPKLARLLEIPIPGDAVLMAATRDGQMNAVDIQVRDTCKTVSDAIDDKYLKIPLALAQDLYAFPGADRVCVLLADKSKAAGIAERLTRVLASRKQKVEVKTWQEMSVYYRNVKSYLDVMFLFLFSIVMTIVVMGTFNTMSMSVYERTREVGTLRAMGLKQLRLVELFAWEGALLGFLGSAAGAVLTFVGFGLLKISRLTYTPPGVADAIPIEVDLVPSVLAFSALFFIALATVSAAIPARRAARRNIVDALGHV